MKSIIDLYQKKIIDNDAFTTKELADVWGLSICRTSEKIRDNKDVEQVWKKSGNRYVPAYRLKK